MIERHNLNAILWTMRDGLCRIVQSPFQQDIIWTDRAQNGNLRESKRHLYNSHKISSFVTYVTQKREIKSYFIGIWRHSYRKLWSYIWCMSADARCWIEIIKGQTIWFGRAKWSREIYSASGSSLKITRFTWRCFSSSCWTGQGYTNYQLPSMIDYRYELRITMVKFWTNSLKNGGLL